MPAATVYCRPSLPYWVIGLLQQQGCADTTGKLLLEKENQTYKLETRQVTLTFKLRPPNAKFCSIRAQKNVRSRRLTYVFSCSLAQKKGGSYKRHIKATRAFTT